MKSNLERMIELAESFFATRNDPTQLDITPVILDRLRHLHPSSVREVQDAGGPIAWTIAIPTTKSVMDRFVAGAIGEPELLEETPPQGPYQVVYLCSALVLPEYRAKGLARDALIASVAAIRKDHPVEHLFMWAFSPEGERLAASVARHTGLPLLKRIT